MKININDKELEFIGAYRSIVNNRIKLETLQKDKTYNKIREQIEKIQDELDVARLNIENFLYPHDKNEEDW